MNQYEYLLFRLGAMAYVGSLIPSFFAVMSVWAGEGLPVYAVVILIVFGVLAALATAAVFWRGLRNGASSSMAIALAVAASETAIGAMLLPVGLAVTAVGVYRAGIGYVGIGVVVVIAAVWLVLRLRWLNQHMNELVDRNKADEARRAFETRRPPTDPAGR